MASAAIEVLIEAAGGRHPASDGAHRLGWWIADFPYFAGARIIRGSSQPAISSELLERIVLGDVEPSEEVAQEIEWATRGAVRSDDWRRGCGLDWRARPAKREG